jgi:hypothetical protein
VTRIPEWVRHEQVDPDRILIAAWLYAQGEADTALGIARTVVPTHRQEFVDRALPELAEMLGDYEQCFDDPARYGWVTFGMERPGPGGWDEFAVTRCEQIIVDARNLAEKIAAHRSALALVNS